MVSTELKGVGLHYTAFRDAIREDSRQTTPSCGVTPRKKFAAEANVESRANPQLHHLPTLAPFHSSIFRMPTVVSAVANGGAVSVDVTSTNIVGYTTISVNGSSCRYSNSVF